MKARIFYCDGNGGFHATQLPTGHGFHEGSFGAVDIVRKHYLRKHYTCNASRIHVGPNGRLSQ